VEIKGGFSVSILSSTILHVLSPRSWIRHPPRFEPLQIAILAIRADHAPGDRHEEDVQADGGRVQHAVEDVLHALDLVPQDPVGDEAEGEDREVERRIVVVDVGDARHGHEGEVVQDPADDGVETRVVDVVDVGRLELVVAALPADEVPDHEEAEGAQGGGGAPVDEGVAEEEVLDDVVVPATHTETNVQDWPLPELRGEVILLVRIRDQSVVGGHHRNIQMDEILEERRFVRSSISGGN
jgi:hypothetical protein